MMEDVERTEYVINANGCECWSKKSDGKKYLGRPGLRRGDNIVMKFKEQSRRMWTGFIRLGI
jgi:hypothetical protein